MAHSCEGELPYGGHGEAVTDCHEQPDGTLWVGNGEYGSRVNFCPYCGYKAVVQMTPKQKQDKYRSYQEWS